jgi:hypothetical protein
MPKGVYKRKPRKSAKNPVGRPTKYDATLPDKLIAFYAAKLQLTEDKSVPVLREIGVDLPTLGAFARDIGVCPRTLSNWANSHEDFADAINLANAIQEDMLEQMTLKGVWVPSMAMFSLKYRHGWQDKVTIDTNAQVHLHFDEQDSKA